MKIKIVYDPYRMKTELHVDGRDVRSDTAYEKFKRFIEQKVPLQNWIDPIAYDGWKGFLPEVVGDTQETDIVCEFVGRDMDYLDFKASLEGQSKQMNPTVQLELLQQCNMNDSRMEKNIAKAVKMIAGNEFRKMISDPNFPASQSLLDAQKNLEKAYQEAKDREFRIVFAGMYSSGKSTMINALIGKEILPISDGTCTSKIFEIRHDSKEEFARMCCLDASRKEVVPAAAYTKESLKEKFQELFPRDATGLLPSNPPSIETVEICTNLSTLYPKGLEDKIQIVLIDTPGTSSGEGNDDAQGKKHIDITREIIQSPDREMVIFTTNATEDKDDSIRDFLEIIDETASGSYNQRFLFVLNKADACKFNGNESFQKKLKSVEAYYAKGGETIQTPRFFPVSALAALEIKACRIESSEYDSIYAKYFDRRGEKRAQAERENYYFDQYCSTSQSIKERIQQELFAVEQSSQDQEAKAAQEIMLHSGIPSLELAIQDYIERYAFPLKIESLLQTFETILNETKQYNDRICKKIEEVLTRSQEKDQSKNMQKEERRVREDRKNKLDVAEQKVKVNLSKLQCSGMIKKIHDTTREITTEMRMNLQRLRAACGEEIYPSKENAAEVLAAVYEAARKRSTDKLNGLSKEYKAQLLEITEQIKESLKTVRDVLGGVEFGIDIEKTVIFRSIASDLLQTISLQKNWVRNPKLDYSGWNLLKHVGKIFLKESIADGFQFEPNELASAVDAESKKFNTAIEQYEKQLIDNLSKIEKKIEEASDKLLIAMQKTKEQIEHIENEIQVLAHDIGGLTAEKWKFEYYKKKLNEIESSIGHTKLPERTA